MNVFSRFNQQASHRCGDSPDKIWSQLQDWYQTPMGQRLQHLERQWLDKVLPNLFGYHLVQVGYLGQEDLTASSRISHKVLMSACNQTLPGHAIQLCGQDYQLPIATDSVDVVVLPHVLEFCRYPHEVLREVDRILVPEGHVVLLTLNPYSLWGSWRFVAKWYRKMPWCGNFLSSTRLRDWLALLGFDTLQQNGYGYMPPWNASRLAERCHWLEQPGQQYLSFAGGSSILVAKKRQTTMTPIRPRWHQRQKARWVTTGLVEPYTGAKTQRKIS